MEQVKNITPILIIISVRLVLSILIGRTESGKVLRQDGFTVLRLDKGYRILGEVIFWFFFLQIIAMNVDYIFYKWGWRETDDWLKVNLMFGFVCIAPLYLVLMGRNYRVSFDNTTVVFRGMFGRQRAIRWQDVKKVTYSKLTKQFYLFSDTVKIPISSQLVGFNSFIKEMESKLSEEMYAAALKQRAI